MYFGKDVNIVQLFGMFETLHRKKGFDNVCPNQEFFKAKIAHNFNVAIRTMRYMGLISTTRQNTFIFKKNFYGKPKYYSINVDLS